MMIFIIGVINGMMVSRLRLHFLLPVIVEVTWIGMIIPPECVMIILPERLVVCLKVITDV